MHPKTAGGGSLSHQAITSDPGRVECSISSISSKSPSGLRGGRSDWRQCRKGLDALGRGHWSIETLVLPASREGLGRSKTPATRLKGPMMQDEYLTTRQAAEYLGSTINSLTSMRSSGRGGPPWSRSEDTWRVRYSRADLDDYIANRAPYDSARAHAAALARDAERKEPHRR